MTSNRDSDRRRDAERRAARRAFIRSQHPDAGGDPDAFVEGLALFDADRDTRGLPSVYRSRRPDRIVRRFVRELRRRWTGEQPRNLQ